MSTYCFVYYNYDGNVVCDAYTFHNLSTQIVQEISRDVFNDLPKDRKNNHKRRIVRFTTPIKSSRGNKLNRIRSMQIPYKDEYQIERITNRELNFRTKRLIKYITCNQYKPSEDMFDYSSLSDNDDNLSANSKRVIEIIFDNTDPISKLVDNGKFGSISSHEEDSWIEKLNSISDDLFKYEFESKNTRVEKETRPDIDPITMSCQINYPGDEVFNRGFRDFDSLSDEEKQNYEFLIKINFIQPGNHYIWNDRVILKRVCGESWGDFLSNRSGSILENNFKKWRSERISRQSIFSIHANSNQS